MKIVRWAAAAVTVLMSLMNVGVVLGGPDQKPSTLLVVVALVLGAAGFVAVVAFLRGLSWGRPALLGVGALNLVGGVVALAARSEGAVIGIVVSLLILVLGFLSPGTASAPRRASSPSAV